VIRQALANARVRAGEVDVVEAHGTGTALGDPIEAQALLATYGQDRPSDRPVWLGSIKSNIGHTQAAAGVAGVIKMVMAIQQNELPLTLHIDEPTPNADWSVGAASLLTEAQPWPRHADRPRRAAVSAFGVSGTNAHVILQEPPASSAPEDHGAFADEAPAEVVAASSVVGDGESPVVGSGLVVAGGVVPWVVSGRGVAGLCGQAGRLGEFVSECGGDLVDVGWSLVATRSGLSDRAVVLGAGRGELVDGLGVVSRGEVSSGVVRGVVGSGRSVFVFPGQGAQWVGMAGQLYAGSRVFAEVFDRVCGLFDPLLEFPLRDVVFGGGPDVLGQTVFTQAGLFAVEVALFELMASVGVVPDFLVGHSIGEISAACVAGVLSLQDAVVLVAARGSLMQGLAGGGGMAAVEATEGEIGETLAELADEDRRVVGVAAVNGPVAVVVSGAERVVDRVAEVWGGRGRRVRRLDVSHGFHSPLMDPMLDEFRDVVRGLSFGEPSIPIVSNVSGLVATVGQLADPDYWVAHVRESVRFADSVETLVGLGVSRFVEVGPGAGLTTLVQSHEAFVEVGSGVFVSVLPKSRDGSEPDEVGALLGALSRLWVHGVGVDWAAVFSGSGGQRVELPTYAFQRDHYWLQPTAVVSSSSDDAAFWEVVERGDAEEFARVVSGGSVSAEALGEVLPLLSTWRQGARSRAEVDDWLYQVRWQPLSVNSTAAGLVGRWLVVGHDVEDLAGLLRAGGAQVDCVNGIGAPSLQGDLFDGLAGVVVAGGAVAGLVDVVQRLAAGVGVRLWCVTRGAVAVGAGDGLVDPDQAALWGLGRVAGLELPDVWGGLVDLPVGQWDSRVSAELCRVLGGGLGEDQVALRSAGVFGRRLVRVSGARGSSSGFGDGAVLITGGTGGLGRAVARYAVTEHGVSRVVLVSRGGRSAEGADELDAELSALGADVEIHSCDVADRGAVADLLDKITTQGPLSAVIHTAGVTHNVPFRELDPEGHAVVFGSKVDGARHLHELTQHMELSAFILFSSISATWGSATLGGYAAANAYLDALAERRRSEGFAAVSIAWGPWAGAGMAAAAGEQAQIQFTRRGIAPMDPEQAVTVLGAALDQRRAGIVVADIDWTLFLPPFLANRASNFFDELPEAEKPAETPRGSAGALALQLAGLSEADQRTAVLDMVRTEVAAVLGRDSGNRVSADQAFKDLGFDSMSAVELRNRLSVVTGLPLPPTLVFNYPTPAQLAGHIHGKAVDTAHDGDELLAAIRRLSEGYRARGIDAEFTQLLEDLNRRAVAGLTQPTATTATPEDLTMLSDEELLENLTKELK
jgi:acyl transferase domain-containing protein/NADP-dependent 3-hydroxy acid dehydrogenase YdfG/acyl carrier protein